MNSPSCGHTHLPREASSAAPHGQCGLVSGQPPPACAGGGQDSKWEERTVSLFLRPPYSLSLTPRDETCLTRFSRTSLPPSAPLPGAGVHLPRGPACSRSSWPLGTTPASKGHPSTPSPRPSCCLASRGSPHPGPQPSPFPQAQTPRPPSSAREHDLPRGTHAGRGGLNEVTGQG